MGVTCRYLNLVQLRGNGDDKDYYECRARAPVGDCNDFAAKWPIIKDPDSCWCGDEKPVGEPTLWEKITNV